MGASKKRETKTKGGGSTPARAKTAAKTATKGTKGTKSGKTSAKSGKTSAKSGKTSAKSAKTAKTTKRAKPPASRVRVRRDDRPSVRRLPPSSPEAREGISPVAAQALSPDRAADVRDGSRGKYVYCVIPSDEALGFGTIGIGGEPAEVHTVNYKGIAAVASDAPIAVLEPTRANVLAHERVNETVMRSHTVIPMSFGTVFKTRRDIEELLRSAYHAFSDVLAKMEDKLEFGLKVLWDRDLVIKQLEVENEDIRRLKGEITSQRGSTYFARMQYGRLVDAALQARSERYVHEIFEALRPVSVASRANRPIGDRMIMNAAFLVRRERELDFDAVVKRIGARLDKLTFRYTGPWPPYNFVNIRLKLERA